MRDTIFGLVYELSRTEISKRSESLAGLPSNAMGGALATIVSSPFNYARNMKFSAPAHEAVHSTVSHIKMLFASAAEQRTLMGKLGYLQGRLRLGWGSARVAVGMGTGQWLFDVVYQKCTRGI